MMLPPVTPAWSQASGTFGSAKVGRLGSRFRKRMTIHIRTSSERRTIRVSASAIRK